MKGPGKSIKKYIHDPVARRSFGEIFSRKMLGSILIGYFTGDAVGGFLHAVFGRATGDLLGIVLSFAFFTYWHRVASRVEEAEEKAEEEIDKKIED